MERERLPTRSGKRIEARQGDPPASVNAFRRNAEPNAAHVPVWPTRTSNAEHRWESFRATAGRYRARHGVGMGGNDDPAILAWAAEHGRIVR